jgi:putative oxidoreductase
MAGRYIEREPVAQSIARAKTARVSNRAFIRFWTHTDDPGQLASIGLLLLRVGAGAAMALGHGLPKLQRLLGSEPIKFADPFGLGAEISLLLAVFGELACGLLIAVGLFTRLAVLPFAFTMLVAMFVAHADDPWAKKELAFMFLLPAVALFFTGPGRVSLDWLRTRRAR